MDCKTTQDNLVAYRGGELTADETAAVERHLQGCSSCNAESTALQSTLSLLDTLPEITPSPKVWENLSREVDKTPATVEQVEGTPATKRNRNLAFTRILRIAAAASLLTAAVSFGFVAYVTKSVPVATISHVVPGTDLVPGTTFRTGDSFTAPTYVVLTIPDVGTLKLDKGSTVRFDSRRRVDLSAGNVFADIIPGGKGFEIRTGDTTVAVHGTRFGVAHGAQPTVYVVEGQVSVKTKSQSVTLTDRQMATVGGPTTGLTDETLRWIAHYESPTIAMRIDSYDRTISRGGPATFRLSFRSTSPAPVLLETLRDLPSKIVLKVTDPAGKTYLANLDGCTTPVHARQAPNGAVRVDVAADLVLDCRITMKDSFEASGKYVLSLSYSGTRTPESSGAVIPSDPITIEVR